MGNDLFALAAAACWAVGSMLSVTPSRHLGAFAFTRWRMLLVASMLWATTLVVSGVQVVALAHIAAMALSGVIGIFIGDTALFAAMNRVGPRRTGVLFATNAIFSAFLGVAVLDERLTSQAIIGACLTVCGVMIAIAFGQHRSESHGWEADRGHAGVGIALALLAALSQAVGTLIAKPVMAEAMNPITASAVRTSVACGAHFVVLWLGLRAARANNPLTPRILVQTGLSGFVGMALGMTVLLLALERGDVGMVAVLSSVTPVLILPLLWLHLRRPPARGAWLGAILTVIGTGLILSR
jgi:drug/metabolite transporter (DMT)-like permease